jgi:hypothetical protein
MAKWKSPDDVSRESVASHKAISPAITDSFQELWPLTRLIQTLWRGHGPVPIALGITKIEILKGYDDGDNDKDDDEHLHPLRPCCKGVIAVCVFLWLHINTDIPAWQNISSVVYTNYTSDKAIDGKPIEGTIPLLLCFGCVVSSIQPSIQPNPGAEGI